MKKKILVITLLLIIGCGYFGYQYYFSQKSQSESVEEEKSVHNSEKVVKETEKQEENESYAQQTETKQEDNTSYTQQQENSSTKNNNNAQETSKNEESKKQDSKKDESVNSSNEETKTNTSSEQEKQDELKWEQFKTDPVTLMILEADAPDWETNEETDAEKEQKLEAQKWIDLGYRVEMPYVCIYLSDGKKCVYGLLVYMSKGVCNETPNEIQIDWRKKNYIGIVAYAKSLGYKCEGYQD